MYNASRFAHQIAQLLAAASRAGHIPSDLALQMVRAFAQDVMRPTGMADVLSEQLRETYIRTHRRNMGSGGYISPESMTWIVDYMTRTFSKTRYSGIDWSSLSVGFYLNRKQKGAEKGGDHTTRESIWYSRTAESAQATAIEELRAAGMPV